MNALSPQVKSVVRKFYRAIGTPLALSLEKAVRDGDWDTIASCKVSPRGYTNSQDYFLDASAASLLRKCSDLPTSIDREAAAYRNWELGEASCFKTNERLSPYLEGFSHPDWNEEIARHLDGVKKIVRDVLGRCPTMDQLQPRHGPGATFLDKSMAATIAHKMQNRASLTHTSLWFLLDWFGTAWGREALSRGMNPVFVRGNRFTTAPKDATKNRPIAVEPSINIFYQLGLGLEIRTRLKQAGIDLDTSQETHRQHACEASISGSFATLDLSNASDTVATSLVKLLLPPEWFNLLQELRSPFTGFKQPRGDYHWRKLEKFSSMGNGFTFELETLLFYAISEYAVLANSGGEERMRTKVFGDDILCDSRGAEDVTALLHFLGFSLNPDKSFVGGVFKESCGGDFWGGRPVRPYFLKESPDEPQQLIAFANGVRRLGEDLFGGLGPLTSAWFSIQDQLPTRVRQCRGPKGLGDLVVHDDEVKWSWTSASRTRVWGYVPLEHREVPLALFSPGTVHACGLYGSIVSDGFIIPRDAVTGYGFRKLFPLSCDWLPVARIIRGEAGTEVTYLEPSGPSYGASCVVVKKVALQAQS